MILKKIIPIALVLFSSAVFAQDQTVEKFKFYGFFRNDFYYNSRLNVDSNDGIFNMFPKPKDPTTSGIDKNELPQSEMISVATRLGIDVNGSPVFGAKSTAKLEADFAGSGSTFFLLRMCHAYTKLNWEKTELLLGQTWHPLFGSVMPTIPSFNAGTPFQPFNRSPQIRIKQNISSSLSLTAAALYEMQYASQGTLTATTVGASNTFQKNAIIPDIFLGLENKAGDVTVGLGGDVKSIKPVCENRPEVKLLTSLSAVAYTQYVTPVFQAKAKVLWGQNMSDHMLPWGYGVSGTTTDGSPIFTNFNMASSWLNLVYGKEIQAGLFLGYEKNLGTEKDLLISGGTITAYGTGFTATSQTIMNNMYRIAPHISYNLPNIKLGLELELTTAEYGKINNKGFGDNSYNVDNKRIAASVSYIF
jgi:hypothetical protein